MSDSIEGIYLLRCVSNGQYDCLILRIKSNNYYAHINSGRSPGLTEEEAVNTIANVFVKDYKSEYYKEKIIEGFEQLRLKNVTNSFSDDMEIPVLPLEPHYSCEMKNYNSSTTDQQKNEVTQCKLKQKLTEIDKDSEVMKFFEDKKCSVCLSNYKEIVDEDLHIVVPSCGHPLCCKCTDNILASEKKECPSCRGNFTAQEFDLMKFDENLSVKYNDQKIFL